MTHRSAPVSSVLLLQYAAAQLGHLLDFLDDFGSSRNTGLPSIPSQEYG